MSAPGHQPIWLDVTVKDILAQYEVGETVGVGGFAVVKRGRDKHTGAIVAIKVVDKWRYAAEESSEREIRILSKVNHPNCIQLHAVYVTAKRVYIVTELVTGGELLDTVTEHGAFSEPETAYIVMQVLEGVTYLHSKGIVHGDLKLENILLQGSLPHVTVKIADFGLSKVFSGSSVRDTVCGSPLYMAPELLKMDQKIDNAPAADVWSVGIILFILLAGYSPFDDQDEAKLFAKIKSGKYDDDHPVWNTISDGAKSLVRCMLCVDIDKRSTASACLQHPWLQTQQQRFLAHLSSVSDADGSNPSTSACVEEISYDKNGFCPARLLSTRSVHHARQEDGQTVYDDSNRDEEGRISFTLSDVCSREGLQ